MNVLRQWSLHSLLLLSTIFAPHLPLSGGEQLKDNPVDIVHPVPALNANTFQQVTERLFKTIVELSHDTSLVLTEPLAVHLYARWENAESEQDIVATTAERIRQSNERVGNLTLCSPAPEVQERLQGLFNEASESVNQKAATYKSAAYLKPTLSFGRFLHVSPGAPPDALYDHCHNVVIVDLAMIENSAWAFREAGGVNLIMETFCHELLHSRGNLWHVSRFLDEGVTEYLTRQIMGEQYSCLRSHSSAAADVVSYLCENNPLMERVILEAYFTGDVMMLAALLGPHRWRSLILTGRQITALQDEPRRRTELLAELYLAMGSSSQGCVTNRRDLSRNLAGSDSGGSPRYARESAESMQSYQERILKEFSVSLVVVATQEKLQAEARRLGVEAAVRDSFVNYDSEKRRAEVYVVQGVEADPGIMATKIIIANGTASVKRIRQQRKGKQLPSALGGTHAPKPRGDLADWRSRDLAHGVVEGRAEHLGAEEAPTRKSRDRLQPSPDFSSARGRGRKPLGERGRVRSRPW